MIKKKVLIFGEIEGMYLFFRSGYTGEYEPVAVISNSAKNFTLTLNGNFPKLEIVSPENLPNFVYKTVDAVVIVDISNRQEKINFLLQKGVEPRKIIVWNHLGTVEALSAPQPDGTILAFVEGLEFHIRNREDQTFIQQIGLYLQNQKRFLAFAPQNHPYVLANYYQIAMKKSLPWNNLQTWTEKMQWLKLFDATPLKTRLTDKYLVRYYVAEKIGDEYLTPSYGSWNNFDDIDFDALPEKFILKCNHIPNINAVVDKKSVDIRNLREKFTALLQVDYGAQFMFELHYSAIKRKIIAEKFIEGNVVEYKFLCFNGKPVYCRYNNVYYDMNFEAAKFEQPSNIRKPKNFSLMKKLATKLCGNFVFVRVDFKEIDNKIYFDTLDFTPFAGIVRFKSPAIDKHFGELLSLNNTPPCYCLTTPQIMFRNTISNLSLRILSESHFRRSSHATVA